MSTGNNSVECSPEYGIAEWAGRKNLSGVNVTFNRFENDGTSDIESVGDYNNTYVTIRGEYGSATRVINNDGSDDL